VIPSAGMAEETGSGVSRPWAAWTASAICVLVFLGMNAAAGVREALYRGMVAPAFDVWNGRWSTLLTSAFVHIQIWHVAFNLYWLWKLGRVLEGAIGHLRWLLLCLSAAFVSSAAQLALYDDTGIGFSGVVYAFFSFMWMTRGRWPSFAAVVNRDTVLLFLGWLVGCFVVTAMGIWNVGNGAHAGGLAYGVLLGMAAQHPRRRVASLSGAGVLLLLSIALLFYAPWSPSWVSVRAYRLHVSKRYAEAERSYLRALDLGYQPAWVLGNLVLLYRATGEKDKRAATLDRLRKVDPKAARKLE